MATVYTFLASPNHIFPDHPERPGRFDLLQPRLKSFEATLIENQPATRNEITLVHNPRLVTTLERVCREEAPGIVDYAPTYVTPSSFEDALLAAGGVIACTGAVMNGDASNAFAIIRPPGHHATPERAMGFCLFNNVAIGARVALKNGYQRVMVIDYDAHHGNGTQAAFLNDEHVAFLSAHQFQPGFYPGTGPIKDALAPKGRIVNVPLPARAGDKVYEQVANRIFTPFAQSFNPQMIFVSVGFDAHWNDPITSLGLSSTGFFMLAQKVITLAQEFCEGKIVFVLEGGYDPVNLANGVEATFDALTNSKHRSEAGDLSPHKEPDCESIIEEIRNWHGFS